MSEETYYQRNKETILNRAKEYFEYNKKRLRQQAKNKYRELSKEEKTYRENMEKIDIIMLLTKRNKN